MQAKFVTGVEKIFYFLGPQGNIENFVQVFQYRDTYERPALQWTENLII